MAACRVSRVSRAIRRAASAKSSPFDAYRIARDELTIYTRSDMPVSEFLTDAELTIERISPPPGTEDEEDPQQEEQV